LPFLPVTGGPVAPEKLSHNNKVSGEILGFEPNIKAFLPGKRVIMAIFTIAPGS
jgi:hypothetical protein